MIYFSLNIFFLLCIILLFLCSFKYSNKCKRCRHQPPHIRRRSKKKKSPLLTTHQMYDEISLNNISMNNTIHNNSLLFIPSTAESTSTAKPTINNSMNFFTNNIITKLISNLFQKQNENTINNDKYININEEYIGHSDEERYRNSSRIDHGMGSVSYQKFIKYKKYRNDRRCHTHSNECYEHRRGRRGRMGVQGSGVNVIVHESETDEDMKENGDENGDENKSENEGYLEIMGDTCDLLQISYVDGEDEDYVVSDYEPL